MADGLEVVPFVSVPVAWMRCIACSDWKRFPGKMWLGKHRYTGEDLLVTCPVCKGTGQVERFKNIDVRTGQEIDYERPDQRLVHRVKESSRG